MDRLDGKKLPNTSSRLIAMAATMVEGTEAVRLVMRATPEDFSLYCTGDKEPTPPEFDRLVDLVIAEQRKMITRSRELISKIRTRHQRE